MSDSEASAEVDLDALKSSEEELPCPKRRKVEPLPRVAYVRSLTSERLDRFVYEPPGEGMAVIYVFVNLKDGKVYVGKHEHADVGESFKASRCQKHLKPSFSVKTYFANAVRKHGKESFEYHIVWHGPESQVDDQERFWIGPDGLHTIKDNDGWGYNTKEGGDGGRLAPSAISKIKATMLTPEFKAAHSELSKARLASPEARAELSERAKAQWANATPEERAEWGRKISEAQSKPEFKAAHSELSKARWANATPEQRAEWSRKQSEAQSKPEAKAAASERGKAQFASPEARAELSERGKKQAAREAAEGKPSLGERGKATQTGSWTEEQRAAALAKRAATDAKKRADKLSKLEGVARERQVKEYEIQDRNEMVRKAKADALRKLEKYAGMKHRWCYRNVGKVQKEDGVHFFQNANGVWCAAFKTRGEGSSSSA